MLAVLRIKNFAIIENLEIEFASNLNVLTGETGAGKSIILKSLELISGKRASNEIVRQGTELCEIEALFQINENTKNSICEISEEFADTLSENELLIRRTVDVNGRSKIYINGKLSTAAVLQKIAEPLIDITSQHEQQSLLKTNNHRALLDAFGIPDELLEKVKSAFSEFAQKKSIFEKFKLHATEQFLHFERIDSELAELNQAALRENEREELEQELKKLANVEHLGASVSQALTLIEDQDALESTLSKLEISIAQACKLDPSLNAIKSLIDSASVQISETRLSLNQYALSLEANPERLEQIRERIAEIARLERKYKKNLAELLIYRERIELELADFHKGAFDEEKLKKDLDLARSKLKELEQKLTKERAALGRKLAKKVEEELASLKMKNAKFCVQIEEKESSANGADAVEFLLSANIGEPTRALNKVASGGELSRILLVLKTILNRELLPALQIFDEVDAGISGAVAEIVGKKLKQLALNSQVILVTHAPQIAALADTHFLISKSSDQKMTKTTVEKLGADERVSQIAAMLAGQTVSAEFENSARQLLKYNQ